MTFNASNVSLICRFELTYIDEKCSCHLIPSIEKLFTVFNYQIKHIVIKTLDGKLRSNSYKKLKYTLDEIGQNYAYIDFMSDYNARNFEPDARLYIQIFNHIKTKLLLVVIKDQALFNNIIDVYESIVDAILMPNYNNVSGYSFYVPNYYCPISLAAGILRSLNMPKDLTNLAKWFVSPDCTKSTIGIYNCISNLSEKQIQVLGRVFGTNNVWLMKNAAIFVYSKAILDSEYNYFTSEEYLDICSKLEHELPFVRNTYLPEL